MTRVTAWLRPLLLGLPLILAACGSGTTSTSTFTPAPGSGGGSTASTSTSVCTPTNEQNSVARSAAASNISTVYMDYCAVGGTANAINIPYVSVYVCAPGSTTNCAWIDHIEVDTGSVGLRVVAAALPSQLLNALPPVTISPGGNVGECYDFVLSYFWGGLRNADLKLGGNISPSAKQGSNGVIASNATIQVINDPQMPSSPCTFSTGTPETTVGTNPTTGKPGIGANGILGVGLFADDGGPNFFYYYACPSAATNTTCTQTSLVAAVPNPVSLATGNSQGVVMQMDSAATIRNNAFFYSYAGNVINYSAVAGSLTYGFASLPSGVTRFDGDNQNGLISASVAGTDLTHNLSNGFPLDPFGAFIDSGTNALYFRAADIPALPVSVCAGNVGINNFACINGYPTAAPFNPNPLPIPSLKFASAGTGPATLALPGTGLSIYDYNYLFGTAGIQNGPAYEGLTAIETSTGACTTSAATNPTFCQQFDFGLPFFLGRTIYFGIANPNAANTLPFYGL